MPIYEYRCQSCGHELETTQKMTEAPLKTCPTCSKDTLEKLISRSAFQLKGGGWYSDLYSSTSGGGSKKSEGGESSTPAATPAATPAPSTEAKPEKKAEKASSTAAA
jgi:putative FmdB family regulatory protein